MRTRTGDLKVTDGKAAGAWIEPRLGGEFGAVTLQVPQGFEAYARILHPVGDYGGKSMRWAEVAKVVGVAPHPEMRWEELGRSGRWYGEGPLAGAMDFFDLDALREIVSIRTADPSDCYFGLRTSEGWLDAFPAAEYLQRLLRLPQDRDYIVLAGPLAAIGQITRDEKWREAPSLIWPGDHSWLVSTEVDADSTLVGGSAELIKAIVNSPALEAWQVEPTDSLAFDEDEVKGTPERRGG